MYLDGSCVDQAAELRKMGGAKVLMYCSPDAGAVRDLIAGVANDGTFLMIGCAFDDIALPTCTFLPLSFWLDANGLGCVTVELIARRLTVRGWPCGDAKDCEDTLNFAHHFGIKSLVKAFPLTMAREAYDQRGTARFRNVLVPSLDRGLSKTKTRSKL